MKVYKINTLVNEQNHILDPDFQSHDCDLEQNLYPYFKQLSIPNNIFYLIGIYIQFDIDKILYESNPSLYKKASDYIQEKIKEYLNFENAELLNTNSNIFFITMFDVIEETLVLSCLNLHKDINQKNFYEKSLRIRTGIYFSHSKVKAYQFYQLSKEQFDNTLMHEHSLISVKYLSMTK